jgi:hypothetical protein
MKNCKFALSGIIDDRLGGESNPEERMTNTFSFSLSENSIPHYEVSDSQRGHPDLIERTVGI